MRIPNNELYYKMNQPFENKDVANESIMKFYEELGELREKYKIADLFVITRGSVKYEDKIGEFMDTMSYGDPLKQEALAAYGYGQSQADYRAIINMVLGKIRKEKNI